jgi:hypothetical protein
LESGVGHLQTPPGVWKQLRKFPKGAERMFGGIGYLPEVNRIELFFGLALLLLSRSSSFHISRTSADSFILAQAMKTHALHITTQNHETECAATDSEIKK